MEPPPRRLGRRQGLVQARQVRERALLPQVRQPRVLRALCLWSRRQLARWRQLLVLLLLQVAEDLLSQLQLPEQPAETDP